jgi:uncharacterized membrane-anchored protein YjiN (DUF445 family)
MGVTEAVARPPRRRRRLALGVLLGAVALAALAFPFRATWWGGWILAVAEAGIVGGLADWFAVTAIFRRPLGLPIPHTALIPRNWEQMAARVGTMVGDRVLTREYVGQEIARVDLGEAMARAAGRLSRTDLDGITRAVARWAAQEISPAAAAETLGRLRRLLAEQPVTPTLATALEIVREHGWDARFVTALARMLAAAAERPAVREALGDLVDDLLARYRQTLKPTPRIWLTLARLLRVVDRRRLVTALASGLRSVADHPDHPVRHQLADLLATLPERLRNDPDLAGRVEAAKTELLRSPAAASLLDEAAAALHAALLEDVREDGSELVGWVADRLERVRQAVIADAGLRRELDGWVKARVTEMVDRYHGRIAAFIENGVRALGPAGAVRLIEEHAGDDLQFIRVNGTLVGGLAGGAIYGVHLLLRLL